MSERENKSASNAALELEQIKRLTCDEAIDLKAQIDFDLARIKDQIEMAKVELRETGQYADHDWYRRANSARRAKAWQSQRLHEHIVRMRNKDKSFGMRFVEIARDVLDENVFEAIAEEARDVE